MSLTGVKMSPTMCPKIHQAYLRSGMIHVSIFVLSIIVYFEMEDETFGVTLGCHMFEINALLLIKIFFVI